MVKKEFWIIKCDDCRTALSAIGEYEFTVYDTPELAKQAALDLGWEMDSCGLVTCDSCLKEN